MSLDKIKQLVNSLEKKIDNDQKIITHILADKLAKCVDEYPQDRTIGAMSRVIGKMASNNTLFISKGELKSLYNKLYSYNTKFAELFQDELGVIDNLSKSKIYERDEAVNPINQYEPGDAILANALTSVFDNQVPLKMYSQVLADKAKVAISSTLDVWGLKPTSLEVNGGNDKFLIIKADYETPKGITSFYVPMEIKNNKLVEASIFMGNTGPQDLNNTTIKTYLTAHAGHKLVINADNILSILTKAASDHREVSDTEIALTKLNAIRQGKSEFFQNQIVGQKMAEASVKDVELPKYDEFSSFEKSFTSPFGVASFQFGDKVKIARDHITRELIGYGYKNPQVVVTNNDNQTIFYGVSLDSGKIAFTVPVKIDLVGNKISKPNLMLCNGTVSSFDQEGINKLYVNNHHDYKVAAVASPLFGLKPSDIINNIRQAMMEGNHAKAEDALNVLANEGDERAYATGFQIFLSGLGHKKEASVSSCSKVIKNSSSEHPICSHTGLPIHKIYQDKEGNCRPLYRRGMEETYEGAVFNNSKIFG